MTNHILTVETINDILNTPKDNDDSDDACTREILVQLRDCLIREQQPKVIQLEAMQDNGIFALKSDGTIHHSMGGPKWTPFVTP